MANPTKVQLVLGAGGARGMAHIGVIEKLEQAGYEIVEVVGCSMGAVVGGIYAAGYLPQYRDWLLSLSKSDVWSMMDFTITRQGFLKGEKVFKPMMDLMGPLKIEDLHLPFTAVATDMNNHQEVHFREGDFYQALRASISIPGLFTPLKRHGNMLVDGGVLNPLPVNLISRHDEDHITVAVNINAKNPACIDQADMASDSQKPEDKSWLNLQWPFSRKSDSKTNNSYGIIDLMQTSIDLMQDRLTEAMLELHKPDVLIDIPRSTCGLLEFHRAKELVEKGRENALEHFPGLAEKIMAK